MTNNFEEWWEKESVGLSNNGLWNRTALKDAAELAWEASQNANLEKLEKLNALEAYGVDNWCGYDDAMESISDE